MAIALLFLWPLASDLFCNTSRKGVLNDSSAFWPGPAMITTGCAHEMSQASDIYKNPWFLHSQVSKAPGAPSTLPN